MTTDLTTGNPGRLLWKFSLPLLCSVIFQQLYQIVDSVVAGKFIGEWALAATGASYPITMIFMAVATGANIGCSVVISQLFGAKEITDMKTAVYTALSATLVLSAALTLVGFLTCRPMLRLLDTPEDIFEGAALYLNIYIAGLIFLLTYNICTGIFAALGDSKTPLFFLIFSSVSNIFLDLLFVIPFGMEIAGVAWATFLAQGAACLLAFFVLVRRIRRIEHPADETPKKFSLPLLGRISRIALPSILQQSFISIGNLCIQGLVNSFGSSVIAGYSAAVKLNTFAITCFTTLGNGISSFTAQNIGAGNIKRVKQGFRTGTVMVAVVCLPFLIAFTVFGNQMIGLFLKSADSVNALKAGMQFLLIAAPFYPVISMKLAADGVLRGAGAMRPFMIATFTDLILRTVLAFVLAAFFNETGIWMSWPVGWVCGTVLSCIFYFKGVWYRDTAPISEDERLE